MTRRKAASSVAAAAKPQRTLNTKASRAAKNRPRRKLIKKKEKPAPKVAKKTISTKRKSRLKEPAKVAHSRELLPAGIRRMVYAFLPFSDLITKVSKLSSKERQLLPGNMLMSQPKPLSISLGKEERELRGSRKALLEQMRFMTSLCSEIRAIRLDSYHQNYVVPLKELLNNEPVKDKHSELKMIFRVSSGKLCSNRFSHLIGMKKA
jgi:hypothetical protein